jgi:hypothetical protein
LLSHFLPSIIKKKHGDRANFLGGTDNGAILRHVLKYVISGVKVITGETKEQGR